MGCVVFPAEFVSAGLPLMNIWIISSIVKNLVTLFSVTSLMLIKCVLAFCFYESFREKFRQARK